PLDDGPQPGQVAGRVGGAQQVAPEALVVGGEQQRGPYGGDRGVRLPLAEPDLTQAAGRVGHLRRHVVLQLVRGQPRVPAPWAAPKQRASDQAERLLQQYGPGQRIAVRAAYQLTEERPVGPHARPEREPPRLVDA